MSFLCVYLDHNPLMDAYNSIGRNLDKYTISQDGLAAMDGIHGANVMVTDDGSDEQCVIKQEVILNDDTVSGMDNILDSIGRKMRPQHVINKRASGLFCVISTAYITSVRIIFVYNIIWYSIVYSIVYNSIHLNLYILIKNI